MKGRLMRLDRNRRGVIGIGLALILFLAINVLAGALLTARGSISPRTGCSRSRTAPGRCWPRSRSRSICASTTPSSSALGPYFSSHAERVEELLAAYRRLSGGKVRIERLDPEPFSPEEDLAVAEGLEGLPISDDGTLVYFGLTGRNSTDDQEVIRYLAPERASFLEYDLTRMIYDLAQPDKPVVAVLGDLPLMGGQINRYQPWQVLQAMYQFFDVRFLGGKQEAIDDDVAVLMLAQPHNVDPATLYAIDQFVMRGGRVLVFVDPLAEVDGRRRRHEPDGQPRGRRDRRARAAARRLGRRDPGRQGDRRPERGAAGHRADQRPPGGGRLSAVARLGPEALAADDVVTGELRRLNLNSAGSIHAREGATTTIEPLLASSPSAMAIDADAIRIDPDPAKLLADFVPAGERFTLAARVTGPVKSAYPDGPPEGVEAAGRASRRGDGAAQPDPGRRCRLLADATWVRAQDLLGQQIVVPIANNGDFAINALDNLRRQPGADQPARARPGRPPVRGRARDGARGRAPVPRQGAGAAGQDRGDRGARSASCRTRSSRAA